MIKMTCDICGGEQELRGISQIDADFIFMTAPGSFTKPEECKHHICGECLHKIGYKETETAKKADNNQ